MTKRFLLGVQYIGTSYSGWSTQKPTGKTPPGIVFCLRRALDQFAGEHYGEFAGSSRTDAGVHAVRNFFQVDINCNQISSSLAEENIVRGLNKHLGGEEIHILDCVEVPTDLDCRRSATSRTYTYRLVTTPSNSYHTKQWIFQDKFAWNVAKLNLDLMREAAQHMLGMHDYSTFRNSGCVSQSAYRHVWSIDIVSISNRVSTCPSEFVLDPHLLVGSLTSTLDLITHTLLLSFCLSLTFSTLFISMSVCSLCLSLTLLHYLSLSPSHSFFPYLIFFPLSHD